MEVKSKGFYVHVSLLFILTGVSKAIVSDNTVFVCVWPFAVCCVELEALLPEENWQQNCVRVEKFFFKKSNSYFWKESFGHNSNKEKIFW